MKNPQMHTLQNGLTVILYDTESFPTLTSMLMVGAGSRYENETNNGVAHFLEHMVFKGTKRFPDSHIIASTIEGLGGVFNAFTSKDHTGYWIKAPNHHFNTIIDVLSDMVLNPRLEPEEIEREKGVITEEINMYEDTPQRKVEEILENAMYAGNPLGMDIIGTKDTVQSMTKETFQDYISQRYRPNNSVLVIAGGFQKNNKYLQKVEQKFGSWEKKRVPSSEKMGENQKKPVVVIKKKKTEQAHFCLAHRAYSLYDPRKYPLNVLGAILGGGMSSRLFREVRERRGLCYYVYTQREAYHDCGSLITQAGVVNDKEKIQEAVRVILEQQDDIRHGNVSDEELTRAKEMIKGRILLSLESSNSIASYYATKQILEGTVTSPRNIIASIDRVTKEDVISVADDVFRRQKLTFALIGPFAENTFNSVFEA
jgi:predicted Zn-dependent peptidase